MTEQTDKGAKILQGFAAMPPEHLRQLAVKGGLAVPANKRSFARDRELAVRAGHARWSAYRASLQADN